MKKLFCTLLAALLLTSCTEKTPPQDYYNTEEGCMLGNTHYQHMTAMDIQLWNPAWDSPMEGICRDPLCSHDSTDSLCPSSTNLWLKTVVTDGEKLYINALNPLLTDENATMYRQIFSVNPDGSDFKLLHTYDATGNSSPNMQYADGYLYFQQGYYNENYDPMEEHVSSDVQSSRFMRIPTSGGKAEAVLDEGLSIGTAFFVDGENYYLITHDDNGVTQLDIMNPETKDVTENVLPEAMGKFFEITVYSGKTWLTASDALYVRENGGFTKVCEGKSDYTFGGGIWYTETAESVYIGTKEMPTGAPGGETAPYDYYVETTTKICRIDPDDYSITEYVPSDDFDPEDTITISYATDTAIRAGVSNGRKKYEDDNYGYSCLIGFADGKLTIEKVYE